jgi:TetR/AcrR family transcriptional repressor of bet genes
MSRPSNTAQRRAEIADGLLDVMSEQGYERATVAAIARRAGLAPGLVHYHFENKEEILVVLVERLAEKLRSRYHARIARAGNDPIDRLCAFVDAHVATGRDAEPRAVAAWVLIAAEAISQPAVARVYRTSLEQRLSELRQLFGECLRARGRDTRAARRHAAAVMSAIEGAFQLSATAPGLLPRGYAAPAIKKMSLGLLAEDTDGRP